jgi:hypothetical protein
MGLSITPTLAATPVFAKSRGLDLEKLEIARAEFKRLESAGIVSFNIAMGLSFAHGTQKKMDHGSLVAIPLFELDHNP